MCIRKKIERIVPFIFLIFFIVTGYTSAQKEKVDCKKAVTQMEMNLCAKQSYENTKKILDKIYNKLLKVIKEKQKFYEPENQLTGKNLIAFFIDSQQQWEKYRDSAAGFEGAVYQGGSMQPLIYFNTMKRITEERIKELKDLLEEISI